MNIGDEITIGYVPTKVGDSFSTWIDVSVAHAKTKGAAGAIEDGKKPAFAA